MDSDKNVNDKELTSTMGNVLSMTKKDEKGEANDATPTSSTDANTTSSAAQIAVSDDPISSTSSDVIEQNKMRETTCTTSQADITLDKTNALPMAASVSDQAAVDADLLEMGMSNVPHEKITEDVEDLVQDLENLLGEAPDNFYVPRKSVKETVKEKVCEAAAEASTNLIPDVKQDNEQVSEQPNVNETESSVEKNEIVEPILESVTTETVAKDTVVIDSTLTEPVCVKESVEVAEKVEEKPMAVEECVKEQEKVPEYPEIDVELPAPVLEIVENVENEEIESRRGIVPEETPVPPQEIIEDSIPVEKAPQIELKPETVENSTAIEAVTESDLESKPETVKEADIIPDEPMDVVDNIQNITEPLITDNAMDVCVNTKEPPIEIPECINSIPVEENEVVHSTILPPAPVIEQNVQESGEKIDQVSQPLVETDKPENETETIETPMEMINNQVENEVGETVPECTEQTQEDVPVVAKEEAKIESSIESGALQIDSIPEQISDFVEPINEIKQQTDTVIASDVNMEIPEEKAEDSVVNSLPVELIPTEPITENVSDEKVEESVEAVLQPLQPCIAPENLETISGNSTIPIDEQFVPVVNTENTSVIATIPQTVEPITDVEATVAPPAPPLDTYQGVEVEKAFGNDMPDDIVQTLPESIENLTQQPTQMSVLEARLTAGNLNNLSHCSPVTPVKELDPIQQAVASIMNVQDNQIEDEIKQEIGVLQVSAIPPITEHLMNNYPIENAVSITNISPPKEQLPVNMTDDVKVKSFECENNLNQPLTINIEDEEKKEKEYSPKVTIKPIKVPDEDISTTSGVDNAELGKASLKMTITKQSDNTHSILKIYNPDDVEHAEENDQVIPKIIIKPFMQQEQHSPKMKGSKQAYHSPTSSAQRSLSPRITIKPVLKPVESKQEPIGPVKITIKPVVKTEDTTKKHSPKLTIKPIVKPTEEVISEQVHSPRITIKPIPRPSEMEQDTQLTPTKLTIKTMRKNDEEMLEQAPKITIKPVVKPSDSDSHSTEEEEIKERIVLKINKGNLPTPSKEKKRDHQDEDKSEKLAKIKVKFSKEGGHAHIVQQNECGLKRHSGDEVMEKSKRPKLEEYTQSSTDGDDSKGTDRSIVNLSSPIVISEDSTQDSGSVILVEETKDHLSDIPVYDIAGEQQANKSQIPVPLAVVPQPPVVVAPPMPRKRGRPRKVPLEVREEFKEIKDEPIKIEEQQHAVEQQQVPESGRPKRSCRGQNVRDTLGIKPRKPRGAGRGRGSKRGMGSRAIAMKPAKEPKLSKAKLKLLRESYEEQQTFDKLNTIVIDVDEKSEPMVFASPVHDFKTDHKNDPNCSRLSSIDTADIVMFEEETRMSAETSSRAQTPAKQVVSVEVEESQSSVQSTATTESGRTSRPNKAPRLEVHQEPEGAVISADQLAEYYWGGNGPFMLQEQVAQFLGINSFKRKYPGISRRMVDMQERDFIRESGLASEAMCDLGLTAVNSADILDIMYSDFQDKYEEYCKHQRDRQAKDLTNKQKALSLAASQEKTKLDITEQAIQSAAQWNLSFNKTRREQRKASMDLQTLTVHYPKGKTRAYSKGKIGNYPLALVPGQFTDYYQEYTPTEINNLPINTLCYDAIKIAQMEESEESEDGSDSDSECSSSSSESSDSSSGVEDCKLCKPSGMKRAALAKS